MSQKEMDFAKDLGLPAGAIAVNQHAWFQDINGIRAVFVDQVAFYSYPLTDQVSARFCAIQLVESGLAKAIEVCRAFDIHSRTFSRLRTKVREQGFEGLISKKVGRKSKKTPTLTSGIVELYADGTSTHRIADQLGISASTVLRILKDEGVQLRPSFVCQRPLPGCADSDQGGDVSDSAVTETDVDNSTATVSEDVESDAIGKEVTVAVDVESECVEATSIPYASPLNRSFTALGLIEESPVEFESADNVPHAGVLIGLALLEDTHLLEEARNVFGRLKNGWYGLRSLVWTLVVMSLLRIKRPEQLKCHDPISLGQVLGLPRAAEVKTIRRKLKEIAGLEKTMEWHRGLATRRAAEQAANLATLYVDGHVRAYHGNHRIGKTHVSRLKRVMRGEMDYWVHLADGQPLMVVHEFIDSSFREALRDHVLPEIRQLVGNRRVRIVFDREGWSRELFDDLLRLNFDFITYRKGNYEPLAEDEFESVTFQPAGEPACNYDLAETTFNEEGWPVLRLIAKKKKNGGQTHILATGKETWESLGMESELENEPAVEIAWCMFRRWRQENWFKYMRTELALDVLVDYGVELDDPERQVVNPCWRDLDRQVKSSRGRLERAKAKYANLVLKANAAREKEEQADKSGRSQETVNCRQPNCACLTCRCRAQESAIATNSVEYERLLADRRAIPRKVPLNEASDRDDVKLSYERKLFTDTIKLGSYEIETRLLGMLTAFRNNETEGRSLVRMILNAKGDIRVDNEVIYVQLEQLSAPHYTVAMQSLCRQMNELSPGLTETNYRLHFAVKPRPIGE